MTPESSTAPHQGWGSLAVRGAAVLAVGLFVALLAWGLISQAPDDGVDQALATGKTSPPPELSLPVLQRGELGARLSRSLAPALADGRVDVRELRGTPVVLNYWASWWCVPCREEAPLLERSWREGRDRHQASSFSESTSRTSPAETLAPSCASSTSCYLKAPRCAIRHCRRVGAPPAAGVPRGSPRPSSSAQKGGWSDTGDRGRIARADAPGRRGSSPRGLGKRCVFGRAEDLRSNDALSLSLTSAAGGAPGRRGRPASPAGPKPEQSEREGTQLGLRGQVRAQRETAPRSSRRTRRGSERP